MKKSAPAVLNHFPGSVSLPEMNSVSVTIQVKDCPSLSGVSGVMPCFAVYFKRSNQLFAVGLRMFSHLTLPFSSPGMGARCRGGELFIGNFLLCH